MMKVFRGVIKSQEQAQSHAVRDLRAFHRRFGDLLASRNGACVCIIACCFLSFVFEYFSDILLLAMFLIFWFSMWSSSSLPFKKPLYCKELDKNNPQPGSNKPGQSEGIYYFGNEINTSNELWFNNSDMRTHCLIFGSTGSGKTETLLSISYNALVQGSGFIYVDGKGDNSLFAKVFSMVRSMGREDDLLVINFMTGARDIIGPQKDIISNTMNPFAVGSSSMLSQLVTSMMNSGQGGQSGDGDMWKGRAISFIEALMRILVYLRDQDALLLDAGTVRRYFTIEALEGLFHDRKILDQLGNESTYEKEIPFDVKDPLSNYLVSLPGYKMDKKGEQSDKVYEQHGYIIMQLTRIFGSLADVYAHIIRTNLAEVDFRDVVLNRRILVVLLPALEKSPDELSNLGKLIIASLKAMLAAGLGDKVEGDYKDVIETKPTNSNTPYLCILDEYGYYAVEGFAVVPAQARSLGFSVVFAGQDLPAFQKASKEEAASICANTNIKICMKLEDPQETWEFFQKTAGEAYVSVAKSYNVNQNSTTMSYQDTMEANLDKRNRVDLLDLKDQREGEAHVFFKSNIIRMRSFYANPPKVEKLKINQFLKVKPPSREEVKFLNSVCSVSDFNIDIEDNFDHISEDDQLINFLIKKINSNIPLDINKACSIIDEIKDFNEDEPVEEISADFIPKNDIFLNIPLEDRVDSVYYDYGTSSLEDCLIDYKQIKSAVNKMAILNDMQKSKANNISKNILDRISYITCYEFYDKKSDVASIIDKIIKNQ
ncbi:intracellular multiplication protein IcmO [Piscirickettsia salmonis]|uniref:Intracellular multiplication protein IcmO n=2 Tax=Piscirickettsia salmonis TaxID=1238 RepID=A0A9Q6LPC3_PISSA|nr:type IV secretion system protein IcmO [Piscirickettsia salmonis]QGN78284.1 intracellular multiplication protein IcmO [Piscirickettsia salmonis]QGN81865.1 intracellular multiplication protein IcmO [Piscirickettsia salmonis]QGN83862.1 intracellular multiplication protein IcmO [Piscirickettsia salmonis]QGN87374.1 intracellular multiplication protein IcmO [Piscirickettsia salmonis]